MPKGTDKYLEILVFKGKMNVMKILIEKKAQKGITDKCLTLNPA